MAHLDLYHRTTPEAAQAILRDKRMDSKERGDVFFSTHRSGDNSTGYGSAVVHVRVPEHLAELDDEFPNGEQHYRVNNRSLKPHHFVGVHQRRTSSLSTGAWVHAKVCPCGEQLVKQPGEDWWSHLDGSISHDHGGSVSDLLRTALPTKRIFGPTFGLDHRLFDGDQLKPDVTHYVLSTLDGFWRPRYGAGWRRWARVYLAGSEASEWTSATQEGNNDFDVLIGVHYARAREDVPAFLALSPEQITDRLNAEFRTGLMPYTSGEHPVMITIEGQPEGPFDNTFYVNPNSWDIRDIKPYAAYDITNHEWAVKPPHLPDWDVSKFPEGHALVEMGEAYERLIQAIFDLPEPYRTQQGNALWTYLHTDRSRAFGPNGEGWYDPGNVIEKWLDQDGMWKDLWDIHHRADEDPSTLLAPANWSNDPRG
jgi:hypothetical protein